MSNLRHYSDVFDFRKDRSRFWQFTLWEVDDWKVPVSLPSACNYLCWRQERAPTTKRLHLQGYVEFWQKKKATSVQQWFKCSPHVEPRMASSESLRFYSENPDKPDVVPDTFVEFGKLESGPDSGDQYDYLLSLKNKPRSGSMRAEIEEAAKEIASVGYMAWASTHPYEVVRFGQGLQQYVTTKQQFERGNAFVPVKVHVLFGVAGAGKTRRAMDEARELYGDSVLRVTNYTKVSQFILGYKGHKALVFDDQDMSSWFYNTYLQLTDGYSANVRFMFGSSVSLATEMWFCTNHHPEEWFSDHVQRNTAAVMRRIISIHEATEPGVFVAHPVPSSLSSSSLSFVSSSSS